VDLDFVDISSPPALRLNIYTAVELEFLSELGKLYQLQASPDSQTWTNLNEQIQGDGSLVHRLFSIRGTGKLFYRAEEVPSPDQELIDRAQAAPGVAECIAKARLQGLKIGVGVTAIVPVEEVKTKSYSLEDRIVSPAKSVPSSP